MQVMVHFQTTQTTSASRYTIPSKCIKTYLPMTQSLNKKLKKMISQVTTFFTNLKKIFYFLGDNKPQNVAEEEQKEEEDDEEEDDEERPRKKRPLTCHCPRTGHDPLTYF
jgi:hypothetical protein